MRRPLRYRLAALDDAIRLSRTTREAEMTHHAKEAGVESPHVYFVDPPAATIVMERVRGERMKDRVERSPNGAPGHFRALGRCIAKLHLAGMVHGDVTTANVILRDAGPVLLDFGLSSRTTRLEDFAVDLRLAKETTVGAHPSISAAGMRAFLEGYAEVAGPKHSRDVQRQLASIERRGRYARVA